MIRFVLLGLWLVIFTVIAFMSFPIKCQAAEKPLIINFTGYGMTTQFTCKVNKKKELDCYEVKKPMRGQEFFEKLMKRRI